MMIPTSLVGLAMGEAVVDVTPRMILAYAAGIGAEEEIYFDDLRPVALSHRRRLSRRSNGRS